MKGDVTRSYVVEGPYDPVATLTVLSMGRGDPTFEVDGPGRVRMALVGPSGPLAIALEHEQHRLAVEVSGADAELLVPHLPALLGLDYTAPSLETPRRLRDLAQRYAGFRLPRLPVLFSRLVQIVVQQLVSFRDASHAWGSLVRRHGEPIDGLPGLMAPPSATVLARLAHHQYIECGILPLHARRIIALAREARAIEKTWDKGTAPDAIERTTRRLESLRGIGPWTMGYLRGAGMADSDAVVLGDYSFPKQVGYFFGQEEAATDETMLAALEPYQPHRFYVLSLIIKGGYFPPRRGPRQKMLRDRFHLPRR